MRSHSGFTLIEILVVIIIISIVTSFALLSVGRSQYQKVKTLSQELVQVISLAQEQAMLQPAVLALQIDKQRIEVLQQKLMSGEKNKKHWQLIEDKSFSVIEVPEGVRVHLKVANSDESRIIISKNGELTPFTIYIGEDEQDASFLIKGSVDGGIELEELE